MRKWYLPLTVLGLGSLGMVFLSERGRQTLRQLAESLEGAPDTLLLWDEAAQRELDRIQAAVNQVAETLHTTC